MLVSVLVIVMATSGIAPPDRSVTVPRIVASWADTRIGTAKRKRARTTRRAGQFLAQLAELAKTLREERNMYCLHAPLFVAQPLDDWESPLTYTHHRTTSLRCQAFFL